MFKAVLVFMLGAVAFGQTPAPAQPAATTTTTPAATPIANVTLPTYIMGGISFNQLTGAAGFGSNTRRVTPWACMAVRPRT